jgi:hypothetical protein
LLCRLRAIANQTPTSYYFPCGQDEHCGMETMSIYDCAVSALSSFGVDNKDFSKQGSKVRHPSARAASVIRLQVGIDMENEVRCFTPVRVMRPRRGNADK